jgi:hypothetical protein
MPVTKTFIHEVRVRELIQQIAAENDPQKRGTLADELEHLLKLEDKPPKKMFP